MRRVVRVVVYKVFISSISTWYNMMHDEDDDMSEKRYEQKRKK